MAEEGDVVRLKSGGPLMTVGGKYGSTYSCSWWDEEAKSFKTERFYLCMLETVEKVPLPSSLYPPYR